MKTIRCCVLLAMIFALISCKENKRNNTTESPSVPVYSAFSSSYGPNMITRTVRQDRSGNLLLATYQGVIRYDGNSFTNLTQRGGLVPCQSWSVLEDVRGILWIATDGQGVYRFDTSVDPGGSEKSYIQFTTQDGLAFDRVLYTYEDKKGDIWFATIDGLSRYDGSKFHNYSTAQGLPHNDVNVVIEDKKGLFWMGTRGEACVFDGELFTPLRTEDGKSFVNIRSMMEDKNGHIWLIGPEGLWRHNGKSFSQISTRHGDFVYEDSKGNIWTSVAAVDDKGIPYPHKWSIIRYDTKGLEKEFPVPEHIFMDEGMFFGISEDKAGDIWVGTLKGVFRYDGKSVNYFRAKP